MDQPRKPHRRRRIVDYVFSDVTHPSDPPSPLSPSKRARLEKLRDQWRDFDKRQSEAVPPEPPPPPAQS